MAIHLCEWTFTECSFLSMELAKTQATHIKYHVDWTSSWHNSKPLCASHSKVRCENIQKICFYCLFIVNRCIIFFCSVLCGGEYVNCSFVNLYFKILFRVFAELVQRRHQPKEDDRVKRIEAVLEEVLVIVTKKLWTILWMILNSPLPRRPEDVDDHLNMKRFS